MVRRIMEAKVKIELGSAEMSYNPEENQVHAGMLFFQEDRSEQRRNFSLFSFVQAVGHELAHSIDPCNATKTIGGRHSAFLRVERRTLAQAIESYPIRALSCLASPASVGIGAPSMGDATRTQNGAELCRKIRLSETFADYMAAEVLSLFAQKVAPILTRQQLINGFANIYSLTCHAKYTPQSGGEAVHPNVATRVAWIMLSHESIRQQLGCAPSAIERPYCR